MKKDRKGQSLIEVIIGVGVAVMLAISLITTSLITQRTARSARNNTQATKLAQEYIEQIRVFRDRKGFSALSDGDCLIIVKGSTPEIPDTWSLSNTNCQPLPGEDKDGEKITLNGVKFYKSVKIVPEAGSPTIKRTITVTIRWNETSGENSGEKVVNSQTILTRWEGLP